MPEPTIDALPIGLTWHSAPLLGVGLELGLKRCEFGERGIWIRRFLALAALEPRRTRCLRPFPFAVALGTLATVAPVTTLLATSATAVLAMVARWPS